MNETNPYAPPRADVTPTFANQGSALLDEPRSVSAGAGMGWISEAWTLVKKDLGVWVLITLTLLVLQIVLSFIPFVGAIASNVLMPVVTGGLMLGIRASAAGQPLQFGTLFEGFKEKFAPLAGLGALTLGIFILFGVAVGGVMAVTMGASGALSEDPAQVNEALLGGSFIIVLLLSLVFAIVAGMFLWFAPQLIALNDVPLFQALGMSFKASLRNILPLFVFGFILAVLVFVGMLPLFLGLLVVIPIMYVSMYISYRSLFLQ